MQFYVQKLRVRGAGQDEPDNLLGLRAGGYIAREQKARHFHHACQRDTLALARGEDGSILRDGQAQVAEDRERNRRRLGSSRARADAPNREARNVLSRSSSPGPMLLKEHRGLPGTRE